MDFGIGFSEIILIVILILVFFGSKELPAFIKKAAQFLAVVRKYSNRVKSELDSLSHSLDIQPENAEKIRADKKVELRKTYRSLRKGLTPELHSEKSSKIHEYLKSTDQYKSASVVMIYHAAGSEVATQSLIQEMISEGKRVILPYCTPPTYDIGIAEIKNLENDCVKGEFGIMEPAQQFRGKFLRSDIQLIICPGVAFDKLGGRLGNGKGCYDRFITELKGKIPLYAFAFDCQITPEALPFAYHDIPMDQIITESGFLLPSSANRYPVIAVSEPAS